MVMEWRHPSLVVIHGPPYTGKTTIASYSAKFIPRCVLISHDVILDSISARSYTSSSPPKPDRADRLATQAFDLLCRVISKQLSLGTSVLVDSGSGHLSSRTHLDRLIRRLSTTKVVLVQCHILNEYAWRLRFEKDHPKPADKWYKPQIWDDLTKLVEKGGGHQPIDGVSTLLLNLDERDIPIRYVVQAVQTLVLCDDHRRVDFRELLNYNLAILKGYGDNKSCQQHHSDGKEIISRRITQRGRFCEHGHCFTVFQREGIDYAATCSVCETVISGAAYTCASCPLALHKSCAEIKRSYNPENFPTFFLKSEDPPTYSFPVSRSCLLCIEAGREFSSKCASCVFKSHLKSRLIPTVLEHACDVHRLHVWFQTVDGGYKCAACGEKGRYLGYGCHGCVKRYHVECVLLPCPIEEHVHGGHKHPLQLRFSRETEQEDYPCDHCFEMMNPEEWFYNCAQCVQTYHLHCAFLADEESR